MGLIAAQPARLMRPEEADDLARDLNESDDWTYVARHDPTGAGFSFVEVYDEDGELAGAL